MQVGVRGSPRRLPRKRRPIRKVLRAKAVQAILPRSAGGGKKKAAKKKKTTKKVGPGSGSGKKKKKKAAKPK